MKKRGRGAWFGPGNGYEPELGLRTRDDLDTKCHFEVRPERNAWLFDHSVAIDQSSQLRMVAVNPDGERRASADYLVVWYPKVAALKVLQILEAPEPDSWASKFREVVLRMKNAGAAFRNKALLAEAEQEEKMKNAG